MSKPKVPLLLACASPFCPVARSNFRILVSCGFAFRHFSALRFVRVHTRLEILENLEKSGNLKMVRENLEKSGNLKSGQGKLGKVREFENGQGKLGKVREFKIWSGNFL